MMAVRVILGTYVFLSLLYWLWTAYAVLRARRAMPSLSGVHSAESGTWPKLSVVVPACNEADEIASAVRTLLEEDYPEVELVLVDDRSTDATGRIIDRMASEDGRVKAIHVTELPKGWLGKVHALDRGVRESSGEFVLFTDADVHFERGTLKRAVAYCKEKGLDHLAALPSLRPTGVILDSVISIFIRQLFLAMRPWAVGDGKSRAFFGVGAFNMVRRSAFEKTPGFEWLRLEVGDDMGLGVMMKQSGARCGVVSAFDSVWLHWYRTVAQACRGVEKAYATAFRCSLARAIIVPLVMVMFEVSPIVCLLPVIFGNVGVVAFAGLAASLTFVFSVVVLARWAGARVLPGLAGPLTSALLAGVFMRAGFVGRRRGGVVWRGTLYPSEMLREGKRIPFP